MGGTMSKHTERWIENAKRRLGPHWKRRLDNTFCTLVDAEGVLKENGVSDRALSEVMNGLRKTFERVGWDY